MMRMRRKTSKSKKIKSSTILKVNTGVYRALTVNNNNENVSHFLVKAKEESINKCDLCVKTTRSSGGCDAFGFWL